MSGKCTSSYTGAQLQYLWIAMLAHKLLGLFYFVCQLSLLKLSVSPLCVRYRSNYLNNNASFYYFLYIYYVIYKFYCPFPNKSLVVLKVLWRSANSCV